MNKYQVEFSFNGKTYKGKVEASSEEMAVRILRQKIKVKSIKKVTETVLGDMAGEFKDLFKEWSK